MGSKTPGGDDDYNGSEEPTANDTPEPTLPEHRPYVLALVAVIAPMHATVLMMSDILHEFRVAREPASRILIDQLHQAGITIEGIGHTIATGFAK